MLYDNTTIQGSWISIYNTTELSQYYSTSNFSRVVTNVTMAMPHAGVVGAMRDPINNILQPQDLEVGLSIDNRIHEADRIPGPWTI